MHFGQPALTAELDARECFVVLGAGAMLDHRSGKSGVTGHATTKGKVAPALQSAARGSIDMTSARGAPGEGCERLRDDVAVATV